MLIQLQPQHFTILKPKLKLFAVEARAVLMNDEMKIGADDNDVRGVIVLQTSEIEKAHTPTPEWSSRHSCVPIVA